MEKLITFISLFDETKSKIDIESTLFSANQLIIRNSNLVDFYVIIDEKNYLENSILINKYEANIKFLKFEKNLIFNYFLTIKNVIPLIKTKF